LLINCIGHNKILAGKNNKKYKYELFNFTQNLQDWSNFPNSL